MIVVIPAKFYGGAATLRVFAGALRVETSVEPLCRLVVTVPVPFEYCTMCCMSPNSEESEEVLCRMKTALS